MVRRWLIVVGLWLGSVASLYAQGRVVESAGLCSLERFNLVQARRQALLEARRSAIEQACGMRVVSENLTQNFMTVADLIESFTEARVKILDQREQVVTRQDSTTGSAIPFLQVHIRAQVTCSAGRPDSALGLKAWLSRQEIAHGDTFSLTLQAAQPCYVSVFSVDEQGMAALIYPFAGSEAEPLPVGRPWRLPVLLKAMVPPGRQQTTEWLYIVATRKPLKLPAHRWQLQAEETPEGGLLWRSRRHFVEDVVRQLLAVPSQERQTARLFFRIFR